MNYAYISAPVAYYESRGYRYTSDAPWLVGETAYYATRPSHARDVVLADGVPAALGLHPRRFHVASGEQSFIQMMIDGESVGRAICVTPCFRVEEYDKWHRPYFMKAELIDTVDVSQGRLVHMIHEAVGFFEAHVCVAVEKTDLGFDIVEKQSGIELGSYGIRELTVGHQMYEWIYGTACAEPRLSMVREERHRRGMRMLGLPR